MLTREQLEQIKQVVLELEKAFSSIEEAVKDTNVKLVQVLYELDKLQDAMDEE